jgi:hypothetical protein
MQMMMDLFVRPNVLVAFLAVMASLAALAFGQSEPAGTSAPSDVLAGLVREHPRLLLTPARLADRKALMATDATLARYAQGVIAAADKCLTARPLEHKLEGPRLLSVSREAVHRVYTLGLAWRLTGQDRYADAARDVLLTVCDFPDWNPSHFLDVAEMSNAVGIGYDWLYERLTEGEREKIRAGLIKLGLDEGIKAYRSKAWWVTSPYNWNQVCQGGLTVGALAVAETDPQYAKWIVPMTVKTMPVALDSYEPDGAWGEGPGYWNYATSYTVYALAAMQTALWSDLGLGDRPGLASAGDFPLYASGPTGLYVNYADSDEHAKLRPMAELYWLASRYHKPALAAAQTRLLEKRKADACDFIWYEPAAKDAAPRALDRLFRGPVELALFRSSWDDPNALFVAIKAGFNAINHGHLDLGNFELDALGHRWAADLGSDEYNMPGYFDGGKGGQRWTYYRMVSSSHNVVMLDGQQQLVEGKAKMIAFQSGDAPFAVVDLTSAYAPAAGSVRRGVKMIDGRHGVLVQDEFDLIGTHDAAWGMTTEAAIALQGDKATLKQGDKELVARILAPAGAVFSVESAERKPPENPNKGISRLMIHLPARSGPLRIAVVFEPVGAQAAPAGAAAIVPLDQWNVAQPPLAVP